MNAAIGRFNEPREILWYAAVRAAHRHQYRCGVFGNIGTYDKISFTAVGAAVNLGARRRSRECRASAKRPGGRRATNSPVATLPAEPSSPEASIPGQVRLWDLTGRK